MQQEKQTIKEELKQPYAFHTKREDYEKHGYNRGCPGCRALLTGTTKQKHTPQCTQRMDKEMGKLERVKNAKWRREEFLEKVTVPADCDIGGQDPASKSKKEKHEIDKEGDVYMGAMEVNIEEEEWGKWEYDDYHDGEFDPKHLKEARLEEVNFMQNVGVWEPSTWEECMQKTG